MKKLEVFNHLIKSFLLEFGIMEFGDDFFILYRCCYWFQCILEPSCNGKGLSITNLSSNAVSQGFQIALAFLIEKGIFADGEKDLALTLCLMDFQRFEK